MLADALSDCRIAYLSGITMAILPQSGRATLVRALSAARAAGTTVVFDPNLRPRLWSDPESMRHSIEAVAALADLILPSFDDEATHFGDTDPQATIARYLGCGAGHVVVKNGGGPIWFGGSQGQGCSANLAPATPIDSTAAGDSFNAGYLAACLAGADCETAICAGHALSRIVIGHPGALVPEALAAL
jgi:2-dehydro-3-deoxygluconokinase